MVTPFALAAASWRPLSRPDGALLPVPQVKTEEQIAAERAWYESEKVWLVHKDGFSLGERRRHRRR